MYIHDSLVGIQYTYCSHNIIGIRNAFSEILWLVRSLALVGQPLTSATLQWHWGH